MPDTPTHKRAAEVLRHFLSGRITDFEFEEAYPYSRTDPAISAIGSNLWYLYSDVVEHRFDFDAMESWLRAEFVRWVAFLYSDAEYLGPRLREGGMFHWPPSRDWFNRSIEALSDWLGMTARRAELERAVRLCGDCETWPFVTTEQRDRALESPALLSSP